MADISAAVSGAYVSGSVTTQLSKANTGTLQLLYQHLFVSGTPNHLVPLHFTVANVISVDISADKAIDIYVDDLSSGSPTQHIAVVAGTPQIYIKDVLGINPFTVDAAVGLYITTTVANTAITISVLVA